MAKNAFAKGDAVQLKTGGPAMTVDYLPGEKTPGYGQRDNEYFCRWFAGAADKHAWFGEHLLKPFVTPKK